jgi:chorismate synthase
MNALGTLFKISTFGESHGAAIGGIIDGMPAGIQIDEKEVQKALDRRKPGQSSISTPRKESDEVQFLSGIFDGKSTGAPIAFMMNNSNQKSKDYALLKDVERPGHADKTYNQKYGNRDYRGGGRSSARETANWVVGGSLAKMLLPDQIQIRAHVHQVHEIKTPENAALQWDYVEKTPVRCAHEATALAMSQAIEKARDEGDSLGGVIYCEILHCPVGLGEPVFDKFQARLAHAMLSLNAVKGFEYGQGFAAAQQKGSEHNDTFDAQGNMTNNLSGGLLGGISNGEKIYFKVAFKPTSSIKKEQVVPNKNGGSIALQIEGRHDPCVLPRAVPIVEALAYMVLADLYLLNKSTKP